MAAISDVAGGNDYAIEEFLFVVWGRVAILMSLERSRCWRDNGAVTKRIRTAATRMPVASVIGSSRLSSRQAEYGTLSTPFTRRQGTRNTTARSSLLI